ncbi:MAG: flagellar protein FlbB [Treponema sp.]|jgi:flagellar protein FlbB|nr:flagellar protein FlbB [Treponema sp.]
MAEYGSQRILGKVIVLLLLIIAMTAGAVVWFDYLNVIDAKTLLSPVYRFIGREGRTQEAFPTDMDISLDAERLAISQEAIRLHEQELEKQEQDIETRRGEIEQMAQELEARQQSLEERENSFNALVKESESKDRNVIQNARYLTGMPPQNAVEIIGRMDDQDAIDVFRKTEEIANAEGSASIVSYWISLLPPERAAELQRKMANRPQGLN